MLQVIISPAKQMRVAADAFAPHGIPPFPLRTETLRRALLDIERRAGAAGLQELWRVNEKLLAENLERLHAYRPVLDEARLDDPAVARAVSPAVFSYVGIQYQSLAPDVLDLDALHWLDEHLWILSGFYGCVRAFDAVQPYRLEMGAKLGVDGARDLYAFWGGDLAGAIEERGGRDGAPCIVNLASVEYARAVLPQASAATAVVTCIFGEELRNGKPVQRATASKIARGSFVRWMAERGVEDVGDLAGFDVGYRLAPELSDAAEHGEPSGRATLVFMRT